MNSPSRLVEKKLYDIWKAQQFEKPLETVSGEEIIILNPGENHPDLPGPDFKNAKIKIGNFTLVGDIEIETQFNNWKTHGHNIDQKYNEVILHVCLFNKQNHAYVYSKDGRKLSTLCLSGFLNEELINSLHTRSDNVPADGPVFKCIGLSSAINSDEKEKYLKSIGIERYNKKCSRFYDRLKELVFLKEHKIHEPQINYDLTEDFQNREFTAEDFKEHILWQQLFYEMLFEALGYSQNKNAMLKLARSANLELLKKFDHENDLLEIIEATLLNVAGLVPETEKISDNEILTYINKNNDYWSKIGRIYDGEIFDKTSWHFFKLRPQNFPTVRIAGGARLVEKIIDGTNLVGAVVKKFTEIWNLKVLINSLRSLFVVKSDGFWQKHYVFEQKAGNEINYFIGISRADEIVINVILPFLTVYFDVFGKKELSKKVLKVYCMFEQKSDNKLVREVAEVLEISHLTKKTIYTQGMIELFRNYCSKGKCLECEIGKIVFN